MTIEKMPTDREIEELVVRRADQEKVVRRRRKNMPTSGEIKGVVAKRDDTAFDDFVWKETHYVTDTEIDQAVADDTSS